MDDRQFEELLQNDRHEFVVKGRLIVSDDLRALKSRSKGRPRRILPNTLVGIATVLVIGLVGFFFTNIGQQFMAPKTRTVASGVQHQLSQTTINKMATYARQFHYKFTVYIPTGGFGAADAKIKAMSSQPSFTLYSSKKNIWYIISEYSSVSDPHIKSFKWRVEENKKPGIKYWVRTISTNSISSDEELYFVYKGTVITVEENIGKKQGIKFPDALLKSLVPLTFFGYSSTNEANWITPAPLQTTN